MARIVPWDLPPVKGGSEGGYTPQPTPTPADEYYNLDNLVITRYGPAYGSAGGPLRVSISGIEPINVAGVASIKFVCVAAFDTSSQAAADAATKTALDGTTYNTAAAIVDPNGIRQIYSKSTYAYYAVSKVMMVLYNGNGEALKSYTLTENLDGD